MSRFFDALQRSQAERAGVEVSALPGATEAKDGIEQQDGSEWETALKVHGKNIAQVYSGINEPPGATALKESVEAEAALELKAALRRLSKKIPHIDSGNNEPRDTTASNESVEQEAALERKTALRGSGKKIPHTDSRNNGLTGATESKESAAQEAALERETALRGLGNNTSQIDSRNNESPAATALVESAEQEAGLKWETALRGLGKNIPRVDSEKNELLSPEILAAADVRAADDVRVTPTITWRTPGLITYGNKLGFGQLNATASVEGTFAYTPDTGSVLPAGTHTLRVTFTPADSGDHAPLEAAVSIVVARATPALSWPTPAGIIYGTALSDAQLNASASVPGKFDYSPAPSEVMPPGMHTLSVSFTPADGANCAVAQASVSLNVARATSVIHWPTPDPIPYGTPLSAAQLCAVASVPGTFEYEPGLGAVLAAGEHKLSVVFTPEDGVGYSTSQTAASLTVTKGTSVVQWPTPDPITYGTQLSATQLCAVASVPGTFEYDPGLGAVLAAGEHKLSAVFTPEDTLGYSTSHAAASLTVAKATSVIEWPTPDPIAYGTPLSDAQLRSVASVPGTFEYEPGAGAVLAAGDHQLSVVFTPEDTSGHSTSQAVASLTVAKATPAITWPKPDAIVSGAALSATQLNATATVPGSFAYTPAAGEMLEPGMHKLSVTLTPIDNLNYTTARAAVSLTITKKLAAATLKREPDQALFQSFSPKKVEVKGEQKTAKKKWAIVAAVGACLILVLLILMFALFYHGTQSVAKPSVQPLPTAADNQPTTDTPTTNTPPAPEPPTRDKPPSTTEKQQATDNQPTKEEGGVKPAPAPTNTMNDPSTAPTRIPKHVAENAPPPANIEPADADGLGGGSANPGIFNGHGQPTVQVASSRPIVVSSGVATGMLIQSSVPIYPPLAKTAHVAGTVELHATISTNGTIKDLRAVSGPAMLRQAAVDAVRNWRYKPYRLNNQPVQVETTISVVFTLGG
jgi:TonB family protein